MLNMSTSSMNSIGCPIVSGMRVRVYKNKKRKGEQKTDCERIERGSIPIENQDKRKGEVIPTGLPAVVPRATLSFSIPRSGLPFT